jgi:hypothetical protein
MDDFAFELDDVVIFELPTFTDVEAFADRFGARWDGWSHADDQGCLFTARLVADPDVADLLRDAQALVSELGLASIRFYLDSRVYRLDAAPAARTAECRGRDSNPHGPKATRF